MPNPGNPCINFNNGKRSHIVLVDANLGVFSSATTVVSVEDEVAVKDKTIVFGHKAKFRGISNMLPIRLTGKGLPALKAGSKKILEELPPLTGTLTITVTNPPDPTQLQYKQDV